MNQLPPYLLDAAVRGMLLALLLLLAATWWRDRRHAPAAMAALALALGLCVQVVASLPWLEATLAPAWQAPLVAVSVGNAVLFWVLVCALFDDNFAWRPLHVAAWVAVAALSVLNCLLAPDASAGAQLAMGLQRSVPLVFALLAVHAALRHWRADLVEARRRLRVFIVVAGSAYSLVMLGARLGSPQGRLSDAAATLDAAALLAIVAIVTWRVLRLDGGELFPAALLPTAPPDEAADDAPDPRLADALQRAMAQEQVYRSEDLSIASLAARLAVPEYRLRRHINRTLGHRNFNAFVNGWRLEQARSALADPAQRRLPVLSIALDAGFQSIGPFNRAFKAATGLTPSEFRRQNLADS